MAGQLPTTRLVYLADREADIMDLMMRAREVVQEVWAQALQLPDVRSGEQ